MPTSQRQTGDMKRLLLLLPLLLVTGCGYGSMAEADVACAKWAVKGGSFRKAYVAYDEGWEPLIRSCKNEAVTRQVLGYDIPGVQKGTTYVRDGDYITGVYVNENGHVLRDQRITKRFKY